MRHDRRRELLCCNACPLEQGHRRRAERGGERQRVARRRGQAGDPGAHQILERPGHGKRLKRVGIRVDDAGQFEREEGVSARSLVDAKEGLPGEGCAEVVAQEPVDGADAERLHAQRLDMLGAEGLFENRRLRSLRIGAPGEQEEHAASAEPSQRERQRARRGRVEPLEVVDRDDKRLVRAQDLQRATHGYTQRARIDPIYGRLLEKERHLERAPPRRRQPRKNLVEDVLEQIAEPRVGEPVLGLSGSGRENAQSARPRMLDACKPERRLADASFTLEHECSGPFLHPADQAADGGELLLSADDREPHRLARMVTDIATKGTLDRAQRRQATRRPVATPGLARGASQGCVCTTLSACTSETRPTTRGSPENYVARGADRSRPALRGGTPASHRLAQTS